MVLFFLKKKVAPNIFSCKQNITYVYFSYYLPNRIFFKLGFTPRKAEQPLQGMELQGKEAQKD